jgi:poly-gamma-glutamate capsule biosynthesis protein CapA/YwtB (metallophosphatase superfamily)
MPELGAGIMDGCADRDRPSPVDAGIQVFLCGDVMLGRGIDQVLPYPRDPLLHESHAGSALDYVRLAERANGPVSLPADVSFVWGAALEELDRRQPDARIINLETSITRGNNFAPKGINYRMSPENAVCLTRAGIDCCVLANNHVLDWGRSGLDDTLASLDRLGIGHAGAGRNAAEACAPAVLDRGTKGRVIIFSFASVTSGVPRDWTARPDASGVNFLADLSEATASGIADQIGRASRPGDTVIVSIHWGSNWGYDIPDQQQRFAHWLIDHGGVSIVHGHSSHHAKAIEVHRDRLILYGCGDFINDYEGITGYEGYRDDLVVMYLAELRRRDGTLIGLTMVPLQIRRLRLNRPSNDDAAWLMQRLDRESRRFGARVVRGSRGTFTLCCPGVFRPATDGPMLRPQ